MRFHRYRNHDQFLLIPEPLTNKQVTPISKLPSFHTPKLNENFSYSHELQQYLQGRELPLDELPFPLTFIHSHYENGYVSYLPAIQMKNNRYTCLRCGNTKRHLFATFSCFRCQENCTYCRKCIQLGRLSQCSPLLRWNGPTKRYVHKYNLLSWQGQLTPQQQQGSEAIVNAVKQQKDIVIWAVCGAGKTEMLFAGIETALCAGKQVLIAAPRTDVIIELTGRMKAAFPKVAQLSLYGGSEDRYKQGQLILATTHQLLRYHDYFDVVIIDEVDAFPYTYDSSLQYAVAKSKKRNATTIYVTATPTEKMKKAIQSGKLNAVQIPRRYHGYDLPVPQFQWCGNWKRAIKKSKIPPVLLTWLRKKLTDKKQVLLFVSSIAIVKKLTLLLRENRFHAIGVHAEDSQRQYKVKQFRKQKIELLVTTTILERGVTIPNINVAVLGAEDDIFTESALVQIAGRAGRSKEYPRGDVRFFHFGKTTAMKKAKQHIEKMNKL